MRVPILFSLLVYGLAPVRAESCHKDQFSCADGRMCIGKAFVCDENPNCFDESDEREQLCEDWEYEYDYEEEEEDYGDVIPSAVEEEEEDGEFDFEWKTEMEKASQKCSLNKCIASGPIGFRERQEYVYNYEMTSRTDVMRGRSNQTSLMTITCDIEIHAMTACELQMKIKNVASKTTTTESKGEAIKPAENMEFLRLLEQQYIRFSMLGGEVDFVCPSSTEEDPRVMNFKRGILSMLQNTMPKLHLSHTQVEKDIVGECPMHYHYEGTNGIKVVVSKERDIESCTGRSFLSSSAQGVPYDFPKPTIPLPLIDTRSECKQEIERGILKSALCTETHTLSPFKNDEMGIMTTITQNLEFDYDSYSVSDWDVVGRRTQLMFDHQIHSFGREMKGDGGKEFVEEILDATKDPNSQSSFGDISASGLFKQLVSALRHLSLDQLLSISQTRQWQEIDRQSFNDAIGMIGTSAGIRFMGQEIPSLSDGSVAKSWIHSLSFIQSPDVSIISAVVEILKIDNIPNEAYLSVGSLLNTYCLVHPSCNAHGPVAQVIELFHQVIRSKCKTKDVSQKLEVLLALRGIGNAGLAVGDALVTSLNECVTEDGNDAEVTVTAINAFRRIPCNASKPSLETTFSNPSKDAEVRIASYLALMRCANYSTLNLVEQMLSNEEVNQVGSFVWTHLTNLQETGVPSKIEIQSLISNRKFEEKFKSDFRKYSKNIEWSGFYDPMNVGASVESNIIFSPKSYVPRSANLNLTADIFGRSFNFFEMGARLEGFERYIEHLLRGEAVDTQPQISSRSVRNLLSHSNRRNEYMESEPKVSVHMKAFGNDFSYHHLNSIQKITSQFKNFHIHTLMEHLKEGNEFSVQKSFLPLDSSHQLATCSGLALAISIEGSAALDVSAALKMDVAAIMRGRGVLEGHLRPSVSVDVRASMIVDGYSSASGIELDSSFSTSTVVAGKVQIEGKNAVSLDFNFPKQKLEVFKASAKLVLIHGNPKDKEVDSKGHLKNREDVWNPDIPYSNNGQCLRFEQMFGAVLCWTKNHPSLSASSLDYTNLLYGIVELKLDLTKTDPKLTSYQFKYRYENQMENFVFLLFYNTPGSTINRSSGVNINVNYVNSDLIIALYNPSTSIEAKGYYTWKPNAKRLNISMSMGEEPLATMDIGYNVHERSDQRVVIPIFQINWKEVQIIKVSGNLESRERTGDDESVKYSVNVRFDVDPSGTGAKDQNARGLIRGRVNKDGINWDAGLNIDYSFSGSEVEENILIDYKRVMVTSQTGDSLLKRVRTWKATFSQFPYLNTKGEWASKRFAGSIENAVQGSFGRDYENPLHQVDLYHNLIFYGGNKQSTFNSTIAIKYPKKRLDFLLGVDWYQDVRDINTGFTFQYIIGKCVSSRFHLVHSLTGPIHVQGNYFIQIPDFVDLRINAEVKQTGTNAYAFDFDGSLGASKRLELTGVYTDLSSRLIYHHQLEMQIKFPSRNIIDTNSAFIYDPRQIALTVQVKTIDGSDYKVRLAYINEIDDLNAQQTKIELRLDLPGRIYYWHAEITFGDYITVSNDIHIDSYRDINIWLQIYKQENEPTSVKMKFLWDANSDPNKKTTFEIVVGDRFVDITSSILILGNEYGALWKSGRDWNYNAGHLSEWSQVHAGELFWRKNRREVHKIAMGGSFNLTRGNGAELIADVYLTTPLDTWKKNSMQIRYSRFSDNIVATLTSKWHRDEFLNMTFNVGTHKGEDGLKGECKMEVLSLIDGYLLSFSSGASFTHSDKLVDAKGYLKWDKDEVMVIMELVNGSGPDNIRLSGIAKVMSSLEGFTHLSASADLDAAPGSVILQGTAQWKDLLYEFKSRGEVYSANEYLKGEMFVTTPTHGPDTGSLKIRVYRDYNTHDEKLMIMGHWLEKQISLNGRVSAKANDFKAELDLETPFEKLSQASLSLGHSTQEFYMTEVWMKWNNTKDLGLRLISRTTSLSDFLMSLTIKTPFAKYKEVNAELRNLFQISPSVRVNSRIFGQLDQKKYGLGGVYEQGASPRLRGGIEIYYPSPYLREVKVEIADNSSYPNMMYHFEMRHGADRHLRVNADLKQTPDSVDLSVTSGITLASFLGSDLEKVNLEVESRLDWASSTHFEFRAGALTLNDTYKILAEGTLLPDNTGMIQGNLALPIDNFNDLAFHVKYQTPEHYSDNDGYFEAQVSSGRIPLVTLDLSGGVRNLSITFATPIENYSRGQLKYYLTPLDLVKSMVTGSASLEEQQIDFEGQVYLNQDNYITMLEVSGDIPVKGYDLMRMTLEGRPKEKGVWNKLSFTDGKDSYEGDVFYMISDQQEWMFEGKVHTTEDDEETHYSSEASYKHPSPGTLSMSFGMELPFEGYDHVEGLFSIDSSESPERSLTLEWRLPVGRGSLEVVVETFQVGGVAGSVEFKVEAPGMPFQEYRIETDLVNRSPNEQVDLSLMLKSRSSEAQWDNIEVGARLKQITSEPGILQVYMNWPQVEPLNFTSMASYSSEPLDLRLSVNMNLTSATYGFVGQVKNTTNTLNLKGGIWWNKQHHSEIKSIDSSLKIEFKGNTIVGEGSLCLPMVEGYEDNKAYISYRMEEQFKEISVTLEAGSNTATFITFLEISDLPALKGNASLALSIFREGNPITVVFDQKLTSDGFSGKYDLGVPRFQEKTASYDTLSLKAKLNHKKMATGQEGELELVSSLTSDKPVLFTYSFHFPKKPDMIIMFGVKYEMVKLGVKGSHVVTKTRTQVMKKTSLEVDNLIWPVGVAYLETSSLQAHDAQETIEKFMIYDLQHTDRRSSLSFIRTSNSAGKRWAIKGTLLDREVEVSTGFERVGKVVEGDILVVFSKTEHLECKFTLEDKSMNPTETNYLLQTRVEHAFRSVLLETEFIHDSEGISFDVTLNTDLNDTNNVPVKAGVNYRNTGFFFQDKNMTASLKIFHPSLEADIVVKCELESTAMIPLTFRLTNQFSSDSDNDLVAKGIIWREEGKFVNEFHIIHSASNLHVKGDGILMHNGIVYSFQQDLQYRSAEGQKYTANVNGGIDLQLKTFHMLIETSRRILDLKLRVIEKGKGYWELETIGEDPNILPIRSSLRIHPTEPIFVVTFENLKGNNMSKDFVQLDEEYPTYTAKKIVLEGGLEDQRHAFFSVRHVSPSNVEEENSTQLWTEDVDFAFKLNNSKFISSHLLWRKRMEQEMRNDMNDLLGMTKDLKADAREWLGTTVRFIGGVAVQRAKPIFADFKASFKPLIQYCRNESANFKRDLSTLLSSISMTQTEKDSMAVFKFAVKSVSESLSNVGFVKRLMMKMSNRKPLKEYLKILIEKIRDAYIKFKNRDSSVIQFLKNFVANFASNYDNTAKKYYLLFRSAISDFRTRLSDWLRSKWHDLYYSYQPHIMRTVYHIELASYQFISNAMNVMWDYGAHIKSFSFIQTLQNFYLQLKSVYEEMSDRTLTENMVLVHRHVSQWVRRGFNLLFAQVLPFIKDWSEEFQIAWTKLTSYETVNVIVEFGEDIFRTCVWVLVKLDGRKHLAHLVGFTLENGYSIMSQRAIDAQLRNIDAKTMMLWDQEKGAIRLQQKLPFVWNTFHHKPDLKEMYEIPYVSAFRRFFFPSTQFSLLDTWYKHFNLNLDPSTWIPPFQATGYVIGRHHVLTFDGHLLNFKGTCEHILAADLVNRNYAVTMKYNTYTPKTINVHLDRKVVEFSMQYKVKVNGDLAVLPLSLDSAFVWRTDGALHLGHTNGMQLTWNLVHDVVSLKMPKESFMNTGGLFGNNNNEPGDDLMSPDGVIIQDKNNLKQFADSWKVDDVTCDSRQQETSSEIADSPDDCEDLFVSKTSPFRYCFYQVDPAPYLKMCQSMRQSSHSAMAYRQECMENAVPVKLPVDYVKCEYTNASSGQIHKLQEGQTTTLRKEDVENAVDVVLLIEVKPCNKERLQRGRQFQRFITMFNKGLVKEGVTTTRFAMVVFGGSGHNWKPSVVSSDAQIFTSSKNVAKYIENFNFDTEQTTDDATPDATFDAITYASNLVFRSPVSAVFVLFPCDACVEANGFDYATMYHILLNNAATLYVFKNDYFDIEKKSIQKKLIGYDKDKAYVFKDFKRMKMGDAALRKQISPPKSELNLCLPLAIETNGAVFSSEVLFESKKKVERLGLISGKRAGQNARQEHDQRCLCMSTQEVTPLLRCDQWENGDYSVLKRFGLDLGDESPYFKDFTGKIEEGYYQNI